MGDVRRVDRVDRERLEVELARLSRRELVELSRRDVLFWCAVLETVSRRTEPVSDSRRAEPSMPDVDLESDALRAEPNENARGIVAAIDETRDRGVGVGI